MNFKTLALAIAMLCVQVPTHATRTYGVYDCGEWFSNPMRTHAQSWLLGYLTGLSVAWSNNKKQGDPLSKMNSANQAFLYVDNYCKANPLDDLVLAGNSLFKTLAEK